MYVTYTLCDHCGQRMTEGMHLFIGPSLFYDFCSECAPEVEAWLKEYGGHEHLAH